MPASVVALSRPRRRARGVLRAGPLAVMRSPRVTAVALLLILVATAVARPSAAEATVSANLVRFPVGSPTPIATAIREQNASLAAAKAIDGSTSTDWAASGYQVGDWWRATWQSLVTVDRVRLYPRNHTCDNFGYGRVRFSDGSQVAFDVRGHSPSSPVTLDFPAKIRIIWFEVVSDGGGGTCNPGLAEVQAFDTATSTTDNLLRPTPGATWSASGQYSSSFDAAKAADGNTSTAWAIAGYTVGMWWRVDWSVGQAIDRVKLVPRAAACENLGYGTIHFSDATTVAFDVRGYTTAAPLTLDFARREGITWMKIVSDGGGGTCGAGLAEAEAYDTTPPPTSSVPDLEAASDSPFLHEVTDKVVVRPVADALISNVTFSSGTTGWSLINEVVLDASSYVKMNSNAYAYFSFGSSGLAADTTITGVSIRANISNPPLASTATMAVRQASTGDIDVVASFVQNAPVNQTISLPLATWDGEPWTAADLDDLQVGVIGTNTYSNLHLRQLWLEISFLTRTPAGYDEDNVTHYNSLTFSGTAEAGVDTVELYSGTALIGSDNTLSGGNWSIEVGDLEDAIHPVWARAIGATTATETAAIAVNVDREMDVSLTAGSDTGALNPLTLTTPKLRPISDVALTGDVVLSSGTTGWNLIDEHMLRTSDNVHVRNGAAVFGFSNPTLGEVLRVDAVRVEARVRNAGPAQNGSVIVRNPATGTTHAVATIGQNPPAQSASVSTRPWDGAAWTVEDLEALEVGVSCACPSYPKLYLDQLWVEVEYQILDPSAYGSDGLTANATPSLFGTAPLGSDRVDVLDGTSVVGSDGDVADGIWQITTLELSEGTHELQTKAFDANDNELAWAAPIELDVDQTPPSAPSLPDLVSSSDNGVHDDDEITSITTPTFAGTVSGDAVQVELYADGAFLGADTTVGGGDWSITSSALLPGDHEIVARSSDAAGNQTSSSPLTVSIVGSLVHLKAYAAPLADQGAATFVSVVVQDELGRPVDGYSGTLTLSSSDPSVSWPDGNSYVISPSASVTGHTFRVVLGTVGQRTVTASASGAVAGTTAAISVAETNLDLTVAASANPSVPFSVRVVPRRADGTVVRQYRGLVTLSSSAQNTSFGPSVNAQGKYQFECGCGDGQTFGATIPANGTHTISVSDAYGNSDQATVQVAAAPTTGADPITAASAVGWRFGVRTEYYIASNAPFTLIAVEDIAASNAVLRRTMAAMDYPAGYAAYGVDSSRGGHIISGDWIDVAAQRIWYANSAGRVFSRMVWGASRVDRFSQVPNSSSYQMLDPGHPVASWQVVSRTREVTTLSITAHEPFLITSIAYTYQGSAWQPAPGQHHVPAGTSQIDIANDPAACYFGNYQLNDHLQIEIAGYGNGRLGRLTQMYIPTSQPPYSGSCSADPPPGQASDWLSDLLAELGRLAEGAATVVGDPIDVADGYLHGPITDFALGGLSPSLEFGRTYDGQDAEAANGAPAETLLGAGWRSSLDWRIESFFEKPEGVLVRGADGGALIFLRKAGGGYEGLGGVPFTFSALAGGGYELTRLDRSGLRFATDGRLAAFFDRSAREMTVQYAAGGDVTSFTDAAGRVAQVTTNAAGDITEIELPDGRSVAYDYDAQGRLISVTDLAGKQMSYVLDMRGRITRIEDDAATVVLRNLHDGSGRVIRQTDGEGNQIHLAFDPARGTTQAFDALGNLTTFCLDQANRVYTSFDELDGRRAIDYDSHGHPRTVTDELGATTLLASDEHGRLTSVTDPLGRQATFDYNNEGDLVEVVDAEGRTTDVAYGTNDLPSSITIGQGASSQQLAAYTYTTLGQLQAITEPGGAQTGLTWTANGYLASITDPESGVTTLATDARGYVTAVVDPLGNVFGGTPSAHEWTFTYDAMGRMTSATDPTGATTTRTFDHMGRLATATAAGVTSTFTYDADGRLLSASAQGTTGPAAVTEYEYDAAGNLTAVVDAESRRTEFGYDALGRLISVKDADGKSWLTEYDAKSRMVATTDPTGRQQTFEYDAADQLISRTDAGGDETTYEYDDAGRPVAMIDALAQTTEYDYDWLGRLTAVSDPLSNVTSFGYSSAHDLVSMTNARNKATLFEYDTAHRLTKVIDALLGETSYEYDTAGQLISRENARGHAETYIYDAAGRLVELIDPLSNSWQTAYDGAGRVDHTIDAKGQQTDYAYDPLGRLVTISPATGSDITFTYDLTGRRLSMSDGAGSTSYGYDPLGRLTGTTRGGRSVGYGYDAAGRLTGVDYPANLGSVALAYDAKGRLSTISDWDNRVTSFGYDALDRLTSLSRPGDLQSVFDHDPLGRVTAIEHAHDGTPVIELGYVYDPVGNVVSRTDDEGTATFAYDDLDRLTSADYPGADDYAYGYDPVGNLTTITTPAGTTSHSYDAGDRISDTGFVYDANGALLTDGTRSFTYDALGRLTGVSGPSLSASYELDGEGNRLSETVDNITTGFDLDLRGLPSVLVAGDKSFLPGMPSLGHASSGAWLNSLADAQGSVLATIDTQGVTSALVRYDPFGGLRPGSSTTSGIGYTGEWTDPTGLVNLRFRAYDPSLGRFISRDTFGGIATLPQSANRHSYALGNPLRYVDPSGHFVAGEHGHGGPPLPSGYWAGLLDPSMLMITAANLGPTYYQALANWTSHIAREFRAGTSGANVLLKQAAAAASRLDPFFDVAKAAGRRLLLVGTAFDFLDSLAEGRSIPAAAGHATITTIATWGAASAAIAGCGAIGIVTFGVGALACGVVVVGAGALGYFAGDAVADAVMPAAEHIVQQAVDAGASVVQGAGSVVSELADSAGDLLGTAAAWLGGLRWP